MVKVVWKATGLLIEVSGEVNFHGVRVSVHDVGLQREGRVSKGGTRSGRGPGQLLVAK